MCCDAGEIVGISPPNNNVYRVQPKVDKHGDLNDAAWAKLLDDNSQQKCLAVLTLKMKKPYDEGILSLSRVKMITTNNRIVTVEEFSYKMDRESLTLPEQTALLTNYPNPFNPETWIPFQLVNDSLVIIRIYDTGGRLVRTLDLGNIPAGIYSSRHRAAYWDGKTEAGEQVSSGLYFYTIHAGKFHATRKMVVSR